MSRELMINPVMLKVHVPICIIAAFCIARLLNELGLAVWMCFGWVFLFEVVYISFIQERIEQQKNWIPIRSN
jgi:hypothetical protein